MRKILRKNEHDVYFTPPPGLRAVCLFFHYENFNRVLAYFHLSVLAIIYYREFHNNLFETTFKQQWTPHYNTKYIFKIGKNKFD